MCPWGRTIGGEPSNSDRLALVFAVVLLEPCLHAAAIVTGLEHICAPWPIGAPAIARANAAFSSGTPGPHLLDGGPIRASTWLPESGRRPPRPFGTAPAAMPAHEQRQAGQGCDHRSGASA